MKRSVVLFRSKLACCKQSRVIWTADFQTNTSLTLPSALSRADGNFFQVHPHLAERKARKTVGLPPKIALARRDAQKRCAGLTFYGAMAHG